MKSVHQRTRSAPSPLVGESWGGGGAYGNASASIAPPPSLTPPHKGEGNAPSARPRCRSSTDEQARLRCVSCFTLGPADALYGWRRHRAIGDGGRSPTAAPLGRFLPRLGPVGCRRRGLFPYANGFGSRRLTFQKEARRPQPARAVASGGSVPQSRRLGASGTFFQWVRLSAMILVDCSAAWLKVAYSTISRCTR